MSSAEAEVREWFLKAFEIHRNLEPNGDCYSDNVCITRPNRAPMAKSEYLEGWNKMVERLKAAGKTKVPMEIEIERVHVDPTGTTACVRCNYTNTEKNEKGRCGRMPSHIQGRTKKRSIADLPKF